MPPDAMKRAQELLDDPDTPEEAKAKLRAKMASYQKDALPTPKRMLGDPRAPTGGEAIEETFDSLPAGQHVQGEIAKQELVRSGAPKPKYEAPDAQLAQQTLMGQAGASGDWPPDAWNAEAEETEAGSDAL